MAESKSSKKKLVVRKKRETVRERAEKTSTKASKAPRIRKLTSVAKPVSKVTKTLKKEYTPIKTGNSKLGQVLSRKSRLTPKYFVHAYRELRQVSWPTRKNVAKLTLAVFVFSFLVAVVIRGLDIGFEKLFEKVILK